MARWLTVKPAQRTSLYRELRQTDGTIHPDDDALIGRTEMVGEALDAGLSQAQAYRAVNTLCAQPFIRRVGSGQHHATTVTTAGAWFSHDRLALATARREQLHANYINWGRQGGRPKGRGRI
jgi:hypothetical protein